MTSRSAAASRPGRRSEATACGVPVVGVSESGAVAEDAEDDRPGYGHQRPVEVHTRDIVTRVHWLCRPSRLSPKSWTLLGAPPLEPSHRRDRGSGRGLRQGEESRVHISTMDTMQTLGESLRLRRSSSVPIYLDTN